MPSVVLHTLIALCVTTSFSSAQSRWTAQTPSNSSLPPSFNISFEGGNVNASWVADNKIAYEGAIIGTSPYHKWFYFQILNASVLEPTTLINTRSDWKEPPWVSYDDVTYVRLTNCSKSLDECEFQSATPAPFKAHSTPYVSRHADALMREVVASAFGASSILTLSEGGRPVQLVSVTDHAAPEAGKTVVWVVGRQHAWEASGSWVVDSIVSWALSDDALAAEFRARAHLFAVPIMDVDNVFLGASGKDQQPVDFNRAWCNITDAPVCQHWNAVRAARGAMETNVSGGSGFRDILFMDSHAPGNFYSRAEVWTQCTTGSAAVPLTFWNKTAQFRSLLHNESSDAGELAYEWACAETGPGYSPPTAPFWRISDVNIYRLFESRMNVADSTSMSYCHETDAASVADYRAYGRAIGRAWTKQLITPGVKPPVEAACNAYPGSC